MKNWLHNPITFAPLAKLGGGWIAFKDSPSPPPQPDYTGAAVAQGAANKDAAIASAQLSNPNIISPYGNQTVSYANDPLTGNPIPTVNQTLTPTAQQTLDRQQQVQLGLAGVGQQGVNNVSNVLGTPFQFNGPNVQSGLDTSGIARMPVNAGTTGQDAIMSRLEPLQARQMAQQQTALRNQGLAPGSEAYTNAMTDFTQGQNDLKTQAALQGINLDMSANNQGYNQALQSGQFGNTAQQQALSQALTQRQLPLNEVSALMSGSQIQNPSFQQYTGSNVQAAPIMQATQAQGQGNMNLYNAQQGAANSFNSGLMGMAGTAAGMYFGGPTGAAFGNRFANGLVS